MKSAVRRAAAPAAIVILILGVVAAGLFVLRGGQSGPLNSTTVSKWSTNPAKVQLGKQVVIGYGDPHANNGHPAQISLVLLGYFNDVNALSGWKPPAPDPKYAPKGFHLAIAHVMIINASAHAFSGNLVGNSQVVDWTGRRHPAIPNVTIDRGQVFPAGPVTIAPYSRQDGWLVFQVPNDDYVYTLLVSPAGNDGQQAAWNVWPFPTPSASPAAGA